MYTSKEREQYFTSIINRLSESEFIEGIVQLGSGVNGYKDEYSDIDLMVAASALREVEEAKAYIHQCLLELQSVYIKEIKLREDIYLIIAFMENGLEFNVSILSRGYLNVKSPLWKVVVDKTGEISEKMKTEHEKFNRTNYVSSEDPAFEFYYCMRKFQTELKRHNFIYALKMLETMRDQTLQIEVLNENKKLHQFKAYETIESKFIRRFLQTYPAEISDETLVKAAGRLHDLFSETIKQSRTHQLGENIHRILK
jgi:predicted nucleotidyltransferase